MNLKKIIFSITLFSTIMLLTNCTSESEIPQESSSNDFSFYLKQTQDINKVINNGISNYTNTSNRTNENIEEYIFDFVNNNYNDELGVIDEDLFNLIYNQETQRNASEDITINETLLSERALYYFNTLENLNLSSNYNGMLNLLAEYKNEYTTDSDLESLAGVFATIEFYQDDLSYASRTAECAPSGSATASAAVSGAISGAIWGFKLGSWLGPAGSVLGTVGGAIAGAAISTIVSIGVQTIPCEAQQ